LPRAVVAASAGENVERNSEANVDQLGTGAALSSSSCILE
jgi:hypothetical protein